MTNEYPQTLSISGLPDGHSLARLAQQQVRVVNVSGIHLREVYSDRLPQSLELLEFPFSDVFSEAGACPTAAALTLTVIEFATLVRLPGRRAFAGAVAATAACLEQDLRVHVCCYRGRGRSPAVAWAALVLSGRASLDQAQQWVMRIRPEAQLTVASLSAVQWVNNRATGAQWAVA